MFITLFERSRNLIAAIALTSGLMASSLPASAETVLHLRAPAKGVVGWQALGTVSIEQGQTSEFIHYACPNGLVADAGAYAFTQAGQLNPVSVGFNAPRLDESPPYFGEWGWEFLWTAGAPANLQVQVDIHCVAK